MSILIVFLLFFLLVFVGGELIPYINNSKRLARGALASESRTYAANDIAGEMIKPIRDELFEIIDDFEDYKEEATVFTDIERHKYFYRKTITEHKKAVMLVEKAKKKLDDTFKGYDVHGIYEDIDGLIDSIESDKNQIIENLRRSSKSDKVEKTKLELRDDFLKAKNAFISIWDRSTEKYNKTEWSSFLEYIDEYYQLTKLPGESEYYLNRVAEIMLSYLGQNIKTSFSTVRESLVARNNVIEYLKNISVLQNTVDPSDWKAIHAFFAKYDGAILAPQSGVTIAPEV